MYVVTTIHLYLTERQMASCRGTWWIGRVGGLLTMARPSDVEEPRTTPYHLNKSIGCERLVLSAVLSRIPGNKHRPFQSRDEIHVFQRSCVP